MPTGIITGVVTLLGGIVWIVYEILKRRSSPEYKKEKEKERVGELQKQLSEAYAKKDTKNIVILQRKLRDRIDQLRARGSSPRQPNSSE